MDAPEKLTTGDPLSIEEMLKHLPALGEVSMGLLKNYALGAAVLRVMWIFTLRTRWPRSRALVAARASSAFSKK